MKNVLALQDEVARAIAAELVQRAASRLASTS